MKEGLCDSKARSEEVLPPPPDYPGRLPLRLLPLNTHFLGTQLPFREEAQAMWTDHVWVLWSTAYPQTQESDMWGGKPLWKLILSPDCPTPTCSSHTQLSLQSSWRRGRVLHFAKCECLDIRIHEQGRVGDLHDRLWVGWAKIVTWSTI